MEDDKADSVEEMKEALGDESEKYIRLDALTNKEIISMLEERIRVLGKQEFTVRASEEGTLERLLSTYVVDPSMEADRVLRVINENKLYDDPEFTQKLVNAEGRGRIGYYNINKPAKIYNGSLEGRQARLAYNQRIKGSVRRVPLLASGVNIILCSPTVRDMISLVDRLYNEEISYGREAGVEYFSFAKFVIDRQFIDFALDMILDCSVKGWYKDDKRSLLDVIRLPDLNGLLMYIASTMYPRGYKGFQLPCYNPDCDVLTDPITIDIVEFIHNRYAAMPEEARQFMEKTRTVSDEVEGKDLLNYAKHLGVDGQTVDIDDHRYTIRVPTLKEYLDIGSSVVGDIVGSTQGMTEDSRLAVISSTDILTLLPWISKVDILLYDDEDANAEPEICQDYTTVDEIRDILLRVSDDPEHDYKLREAIYKRMDEAQLIIPCYRPQPCPHCGTTIPTVSGMTTLDPIASFFTLALWRVRMHFQRKMELQIQHESKEG